MEDKLKNEVHFINNKYVLVTKTIEKILHPMEAAGLVKMLDAEDKTGHFSGEGLKSVL